MSSVDAYVSEAASRWEDPEPLEIVRKRSQQRLMRVQRSGTLLRRVSVYESALKAIFRVCWPWSCGANYL